MQRVSTINGNVVLPDRHFGSQSLFRILAQVHFCQSFELTDEGLEVLRIGVSLGVEADLFVAFILIFKLNDHGHQLV